MFPKLYGQKKGNEVILLDQTVSGIDAVKYGFATGLIDNFDPKKDWFEPSVIPAIPKLLDTDYDTLVNAMELLHQAKDNKKIEEVTRGEANASIKKWKHPNSLKLMFKYMQGLRE